jgi:uncharacterized membrane protein YdjX (TVP38/TMEM64 family)
VALRRFAPLIAIAVLTVIVLALGWHRHLSFESIARHHGALTGFVARHEASAVAAYIVVYAAVIALSIPVGVYFTLIGGILFGAMLGGSAAVVGASLGAIGIFLIAKSALGEYLVRRAGPLAQKLAEGFRADAFSYLLFLRLVPIFPFWLVNLVPALVGVGLAPFALATVLGMLPVTFAFAFVGEGLASVIAAQESAYRACLATQAPDCRLVFRMDAAFTPELVGALVVLGLLALLPVAVKRLRARSRLPRALG